MPNGAPFDADAYPWTKGICKAWDDPGVSTIALQFAARLGKTAIAQSLMVCGLANRPGPALFGSSTETLAKQTAKKKLLPILRETDQTRSWVPDDKDLLASRLDLSILTIYIAWSGSPTTLADIDPIYSHANEVDKWTFDASLEADRIKLFLERGIENPDRKAILEGTPTVQGHSRIDRLRVNGWDCKFPVPCPVCGRYQVLRVNEGKDPLAGGLWWDRTSTGEHPSPSVATETARYICEYCHAEIDDEHRRPMIRRGVWVPRGQRAIKGGRIVGSQMNKGPRASFQLSRIYAPTFTFGDIAFGYVESRGDITEEQNFTNSWKAEVHVPRSRYAKWEDVAYRVTGTHARYEIPEDTNFLTVGVDRQIDHMPFLVCAWNRNQAGSVVTYGLADNWQELFLTYLHSWWAHPVLGDILPSIVLIDSGDEPDDVRHACMKYHQDQARVWPSIGMRSGVMSGKPYRLESLDEERSNKRSLRGMKLVKINTGIWQSWVDNCLFRRRPGDPNSISMPRDSVNDEDLFLQLLNEWKNEKGVWVPVHDHIPVDYRDCLRYARVAAEIFVRGNWGQLRKPRKPVVKAKPREAPPVDEEPAQERRRKWSRRKKRLGRRGTRAQ